jgi:hypothetical protein
MARTTSLRAREHGTQRSTARRPQVDFLGIGVQKAGTTWLHRMLGAHPDVFMAQSDDKDLRFFSACYDYGYAWYERHFEAGNGAKLRGEFSTSYFYCKDAPERVRRYHAGMRLVLSLRDPVARLISHHKHEIRLGRVRDDLSLARGIESNPSYIEQSLYFSQLSRWLEHFSMSSIHVVIFENLFADPARAVRELYEFVGVEPSFTPDALHERINEGRVPRSRLLERGVRLSSSALRAAGGNFIVAAFKKARVDKWVRSGNTRSDDGFEVDPELVDRLRAQFAPENAKLAALIGRDLSIWAGQQRAKERSCATG